MGGCRCRVGCHCPACCETLNWALLGSHFWGMTQEREATIAVVFTSKVLAMIATQYRRSVTALASIALLLAGCASSSKSVSTSYVSSMHYQTYDCDQLQGEAQRLVVRVGELSGQLDDAANKDAAIVVVGALLFWPALFALGGNKQQEAEYARLKGEYEAVQQAAVAKKCTATLQASAARTGDAADIPAGSSATPTAAEAKQGLQDTNARR